MATPYTVYHPLGAETFIEGGVGVSAHQQRTALDAAGVTYTGDASESYDLAHLNFLGPKAVWTLHSAHRQGSPVVVHAHSLGDNVANTYRFSNSIAPWLTRYYSMVYRRADAVIAVSDHTRTRLRNRGIDGPIHVVSNGVDTDALDGVDDVEPAGPPRPTVINLAQVYEIKGIETFIDIGRTLPDTEFRWWGHRHPLLAPRSTKRLVQQAPDNVGFPGFIDDKRRAFAGGDVFLSPSHQETQGMSVLEAAFCGLPIVVRDIPVFEYLTHEKTCLKGETTEELAQAVRRLLNDKQLRDELSRAAHELALEHTLDDIGQDLRRVYERTLAE